MIYHKFTEAGLGQAPFHFIGMSENAIRYPDGSIQPAGTCGYCSTGIRYEFAIQSACGKRSVVGCECIKKVNDYKLLTDAQYAKKQYLRTQRDRHRLEQTERQLQAQRDQNGGLTNWEVYQRTLEEKKAEQRKKGERFANEIARLRDGKGGFRDSIANDLEVGRVPVGRGLDITIDILAKQKGRRNSKPYLLEVERLEELFQ